jgi:hypothetical protein
MFSPFPVSDPAFVGGETAEAPRQSAAKKIARRVVLPGEPLMCLYSRDIASYPAAACYRKFRIKPPRTGEFVIPFAHRKSTSLYRYITQICK